jgi:hypothetical protein
MHIIYIAFFHYIFLLPNPQVRAHLVGLLTLRRYGPGMITFLLSNPQVISHLVGLLALALRISLRMNQVMSLSHPVEVRKDAVPQLYLAHLAKVASLSMVPTTTHEYRYILLSFVRYICTLYIYIYILTGENSGSMLVNKKSAPGSSGESSSGGPARAGSTDFITDKPSEVSGPPGGSKEECGASVVSSPSGESGLVVNGTNNHA